SFDRDAPPTQSEVDPLEQLLEKVNNEGAPGALVVDDKNVTFPKILSDDTSTTTALAAVKDERGRLLEQGGEVAGVGGAPVDGSALPKTALPAGDLLSATRVTTDPKDELGQLARSRIAEGDAELAPPGQQGGYEIQVASFQDPADADAFVEQ